MPEAFEGGKQLWDFLRDWNENRMFRNRQKQPPGWMESVAGVRDREPEMIGPMEIPPSMYAPKLREPFAGVGGGKPPVMPPAAPAAPPPSSVAATGPGAAPSPNPSAPPPSGQMGPPESLAGGGVAPNSSIWEELGPEGIEAILEGQAIEEQKQYADALRRTPGAEGRTVRNGIYVGASPLEHIAVGYRRHKGKKGVKEAQQKQQGIRKSIIDILREKTEEQEEPSLAPTSMRDLM